MLEKLSNNILHEATILLKKQNNYDNEKIGTSFQELFEIKNSRNDKPVKEVEPEQKPIQQNTDLISQTQEFYEQADKTNFNNEIKKDNAEYRQKNINNENPNLKFDSKSAKANSSLNVKNEKARNKNNDELNVELFANLKINTLVYKDLSLADKQKIKEIIRDVKAGVINENTAKIFIDQILKAGTLGKAQFIENNKLKSDNKGNNLSEKLQSKTIDNEKEIGENKKAKVVNSNENKSSERFNQTLKKQTENILKNDSELNIKENKTQEINLKDFKLEINLNALDDKLNSSGKVKIDNTRLLELNKESLFYDIAKNTKIMLGNNQTSFSTMIRPENMGRIDLNFIVKDGKVNGRMILQTQEVADFFRANVEEFKAVLQKSNVDLQNLDIILAGHRFNNDNNNAGNREHTANNDLKVSNEWSNRIEQVFSLNNVLSNYSERDLTNINLIV